MTLIIPCVACTIVFHDKHSDHLVEIIENEKIIINWFIRPALNFKKSYIIPVFVL